MGINIGQEIKIEESIYWDVNHHFVIIVGLNNLRKFLYALEEEKERRDLPFFKGDLSSYFKDQEVRNELGERVYSYTISE